MSVYWDCMFVLRIYIVEIIKVVICVCVIKGGIVSGLNYMVGVLGVILLCFVLDMVSVCGMVCVIVLVIIME